MTTNNTTTIRITDNEPLENGDVFNFGYVFDAIDMLIKYYKKQGYKKADISVSVISGAIFDVTLSHHINK